MAKYSVGKVLMGDVMCWLSEATFGVGNVK
nr:MAG TPA: hypothetical protein [Caudoviricetes sp.]